MDQRLRMLDDSYALVRCVDKHESAWRRGIANCIAWWRTPVWVRLLPFLVFIPVFFCMKAALEAWGRLSTAVFHKPWLSNQEPAVVISALMVLIPVTIFVLGFVAAPVTVMTVLTNRAIKRRSHAIDRARRVCLACKYEFGALPATRVKGRGVWVICPECGGAWDELPQDGSLPPARPVAGYRSVLKAGVRSSTAKLTLQEKAAIATPALPIAATLALFGAHAYVLSHPHILEWIMKYQDGTYLTSMFLPSLGPVCLFLVSSIMVGQATVARLIPPLPRDASPATTEAPT